MVSVDLKEMEHIAKKYANGNMSEYIRQLIHDDHTNRENKENIRKQTVMSSTISSIIIGISFIMLSLALIIPFMLIAALLFLFFGGTILIIYGLAIVYFLRYKKTKGEKKCSLNYQ